MEEGLKKKSLYQSGWEVEKFQSGGGNGDTERNVKGSVMRLTSGWHTYKIPSEVDAIP